MQGQLPIQSLTKFLVNDPLLGGAPLYASPTGPSRRPSQDSQGEVTTMDDRLLRRREVEKITGIAARPSIDLCRTVSSPVLSRSALPPSGGGRATSRPGWSHGRWPGVILDRPTQPRYGLDHPNPRFDFP